MKLLLDENLSRRLVAPLQEIYPGTTQVEFVGLAGVDDVVICERVGQTPKGVPIRNPTAGKTTATHHTTVSAEPLRVSALHFPKLENAACLNAQ
ncbi:MAG: hypothetical protein EAZ30_04095 [Betaproteobacteria bacterium]|nr:MAG: hypothetical protein EAZ43_03305 [Betaproteobacteria bacterium]TAG49237.1 MAG: hypothetical protein EAZ30_04095 [Betaproteobacteria bacterium]